MSIDEPMHQKMENIQQITKDFENAADLMDDSEFGRRKRIDVIKSLPQALSMKREIRENLARTVRHRSSLSGDENVLWRNCCNGFKLFVVNSQIWWHQAGKWEIWYSALKEVEGYFGSSVAAYFKFLRFLFILNIIAALIICSFIILPQALFNSSDTPVIERLVAENRIDAEPLTLVPDDDETGFSFFNLFNAKGALGQSILFYGAYSNETFSLNGQSFYSIPNAFVMVIMFVYVLIFLILSVSVGSSYRTSFIESSGSAHKMFSHKILCAWDFGISNHKASEMKRRAVLAEFREMLQQVHASQDVRSRWHQLWNLSLQFAGHALCFLLLVGLGLGLWSILNEKPDEWSDFLVPLLINLSLTIYQNIFHWISKVEEYRSPNTILHIELFRNFLLETTVVGVLVMNWLQTTADCWETKIGQEIYRIVIVDIVLTGLLVPAYYAGRYLLHRSWSAHFELPNFDISHACLKVVFIQTLGWFGMVYAPGLPLLVVVKMIFLFYVKVSFENLIKIK